MSYSSALCAKTTLSCFVSAVLLPARPQNSRNNRSARRRRYQARPHAHAVEPSSDRKYREAPSFLSDTLSNDDEDVLDAAARRAEATANGSACFLACVECGAVYALDAEELDNDARPVQCALCRHEWLASAKDLLWGADHARVAAAPRSEAAAAAARRAHQAASAGRGAWNNERTTEAEGLAPLLADGGGDALLDDEETEGDVDEGDDEGLHIFVGNLSFRANEQDLTRAFASYGKVKLAHIPTDGLGASRGYGFVQMAKRADGHRAMVALQGVSLVGRDIALSEARPRQPFEASRRQSGGGGGAFRDKSTRPSGRLRDISPRSKYVPRRNWNNNYGNGSNDRGTRHGSSFRSDEGVAGNR